MNYLDLFHGIGGFALGAHWAGMKFENHFCSDIEPYAVELYKKRFPDSVQLGDITKIDWHKLKKDYPGEWIISGGFPCQDISCAGKGKGLIDAETGEKTRSGLWYDYQRGISILRPKFAIMENVGALLIRGIDAVLGSLAEIGYNAEWQSITAESIGAPHKRERIWIIAYPESTGARVNEPHPWRQFDRENKKDRGDSNKKIPDTGCQLRDEGNAAELDTKKKVWTPSIIHNKSSCKGQGRNKRRISEKQGFTRVDKKIPDTKCIRSQGQGKHEQPINKKKDQIRETDRVINDGKRKAWNWTIEPSVCRMVNGLSNELDRYQGRLSNKSYKRVDKLKGLGNAIVPQIAEILFNYIKVHL